MTNDLINKYRPDTFDGVIGQGPAIRSIERAIEDETGSSFLLTGPSGVGKTTIARIIAYELGCTDINIIEIDAATNTGVDAMRDYTAMTKYKGFGKNPNRTFIVDECHSISKQAWQSLLKSIEEPPEHIFWIFCTTEPAKVPATVKTRCLCYDLKPVKQNEIDTFISSIAKKEKYEETEEHELILGLVIRMCGGSPRQALSLFAQCMSCDTYKEALVLLSLADENNSDVIDICRMLIKGNTSWVKYMKLLKGLDDINPESIRLVILAYFSKALLNSKEDKSALKCLAVLDAFSEFYNPNEKFAPLLVSLGGLVFDNEEEEEDD